MDKDRYDALTKLGFVWHQSNGNKSTPQTKRRRSLARDPNSQIDSQRVLWQGAGKVDILE